MTEKCIVIGYINREIITETKRYLNSKKAILIYKTKWIVRWCKTCKLQLYSLAKCGIDMQISIIHTQTRIYSCCRRGRNNTLIWPLLMGCAISYTYNCPMCESKTPWSMKAGADPKGRTWGTWPPYPPQKVINCMWPTYKIEMQIVF